MDCSSHLQQPARNTAMQPETHPTNRSLSAERRNILDTAFEELEPMFMARCLRCQPPGNGGFDNDRVPVRLQMNSRTAPRPSSKAMTPREALQNNPCGTLQFHCTLCGAMCDTINLNDTPERLYLDLRHLVCHDLSLPLLVSPHNFDPSIPADAALCCALAHKFSVEQHLTDDVLTKIEQSLAAGALQKVLEKKMAAAAAKHGDPRKTCIRIGVNLESLGPISAVMQLWPSGHASPKHQHNGCAGSVHLVHGNLHMRLYKTLQSHEPLHIPGYTGHSGAIELQAPATTWLNRSNWYVHEVAAPARSEGVNPRGFALTLHVYKNYVDEFCLSTEAERGSNSIRMNPPHDFVWVMDVPDHDSQEHTIPSFSDMVLADVSVSDAQGRSGSECDGVPVLAHAAFSKMCSWMVLNFHVIFVLVTIALALSILLTWEARHKGRSKSLSFHGGRCDAPGGGEARHGSIDALELDPCDLEAWNGLGGVVHGISYTARECFLRALELDQTKSRDWCGLDEHDGGKRCALCFDGRQCHSYMHPLDLNPRDAKAWNDLGENMNGEVMNGFSYTRSQCFAGNLVASYAGGRCKDLGHVKDDMVNGNGIRSGGTAHTAIWPVSPVAFASTTFDYGEPGLAASAGAALFSL